MKRSGVTAIIILILMIILTIIATNFMIMVQKEKEDIKFTYLKNINKFKGTENCKILVYTQSSTDYLKYVYDTLKNYYPSCSIDIRTDPPTLQDIMESNMFICDNALNVYTLRQLADRTNKVYAIITPSCYNLLNGTSKKNMYFLFKVEDKGSIYLENKDVLQIIPSYPSIYIKEFNGFYPILYPMEIEEFVCEEREEYSYRYIKYGLPPSDASGFICRTGNFFITATSLNDLYKNKIYFGYLLSILEKEQT